MYLYNEHSFRKIRLILLQLGMADRECLLFTGIPDLHQLPLREGTS